MLTSVLSESFVLVHCILSFETATTRSVPAGPQASLTTLIRSRQTLALLKSSLTLSSLLSPKPVDMDACFSACPAFLVGSLASKPEDRKVFRAYIESLGKHAFSGFPTVRCTEMR